MTKVLIIEDDSDIRELLQYHLAAEGWDTMQCAAGDEAVAAARAYRPDVMILDLMLPGMNGVEVCKACKADMQLASMAILMLTARSEEVDRIVGFEVGADDYVTKPFSPRELVLRVKSMLRRGSHSEVGKVLRVGSIVLDEQRFCVTVHETEVKLTAIEFRLLQYFLQRPGLVASRDQLLNDVWGYDAALTTRTVDTHVKRLREKLGAGGDVIETVRGVGYRVRAEGDT